jgi:hypothetical protein
MKKITVLLMSLVFIAFMGLSVSANSDEVKPEDPTVVDPTPVEPDVVDPIVIDDEGEVTNPCGENIEVCIFTTGEGVDEGSVGTGEEVKVCTIDENGTESCVSEIVLPDGKPIDNTVDETPVDCEKDPTICQRTNDGGYEDGIYTLTGAKDLAAQDNSMVTVSVVASTLGLIIVGLAFNRKLKKN